MKYPEGTKLVTKISARKGVVIPCDEINRANPDAHFTGDVGIKWEDGEESIYDSRWLGKYVKVEEKDGSQDG